MHASTPRTGLPNTGTPDGGGVPLNYLSLTPLNRSVPLIPSTPLGTGLPQFRFSTPVRNMSQDTASTPLSHRRHQNYEKGLEVLGRWDDW